MADEINSLTPGTPLTEEQRAALARANVESSMEAQRLAAEHQERDRQEGKGQHTIATVADMLKDKLAREEFHAPEEGVRSHTKTE